MSTVLSNVPVSDLVFSGACIRLAEDGPYIHTNTAHASINVDAVFIDDVGDVRVEHSGMGVVVSVTMSPDETVAGMKGIIGGGSGGTGATRFRLFDTRIGRRLNLSRPEDYARVAGEYSNLWLTWMHYLPAVAPSEE